MVFVSSLLNMMTTLPFTSLYNKDFCDYYSSKLYQINSKCAMFVIIWNFI